MNTKKEKIIVVTSEAGLLVLGQAVPAINRPTLGGLERNFALFSTV
jgi:hypothetical protein